MKKIFYTSLITGLIIFSGCSSDDDTPKPAAQTTTPKAATTCATSTWKYEVSLGTPVAAGTFQIRYNDEFGTQMIDTTITSTWSKTFTMQHAGLPSGLYQLLTQVELGPSGLTTYAQGGNVINDIMVTIYQNGNIVQTTGVPYQYCSGIYSPCSKIDIIQKSHLCDDN